MEQKGNHMGVVNVENSTTDKIEANQNLLANGKNANIKAEFNDTGIDLRGAQFGEKVVVNFSKQVDKESNQLSSDIRVFNDKPICERAHVFHGEIQSRITGKRKLAIKFIQYNEKSVKEANILVKLNSHPNVVSIFHSDIYNAGPMKFIYIAMELCHEQNLRQHINESRARGIPFNPVTMNSYVEQVIEGIKFIHKCGILHRDLKLDNLLLSLDKKFLKICDFGLSKELKCNHSVTKQSLAGIGSVGHMAPETFNDKVVSKMSDIFSLGIVIYALWSYGLHPFGNDPDSWNSNIKQGKNQDLSQLLVSNKKDATDLLEKVLQFKPEQRLTAEEIQNHEYFKRKDVIRKELKQQNRPNQVKVRIKNIHTGNFQSKVQQPQVENTEDVSTADKEKTTWEAERDLKGFIYGSQQKNEFYFAFFLSKQTLEEEIQRKMLSIDAKMIFPVYSAKCLKEDVINATILFDEKRIFSTPESHSITISENFARHVCTFGLKCETNQTMLVGAKVPLRLQVSLKRSEVEVSEWSACLDHFWKISAVNKMSNSRIMISGTTGISLN